MSGVTEELIIEAGRAEKNYWRDIWRYRELFYILSWRDIKVRYKQTVIGAAWSVIRPLLTMLIFTFVFGQLGRLAQPGGAPYPIIVFAGLLPWQFFSTALSEASGSLVGNANLITKVYFPRLIIPASSIIVSFVDFAISFLLLVAVMLFYQYLPPLQVLLLPVFILIAFLISFGVGLYVTALNVKYRDFRYVIPFIVQLGIYITPVGYSSTEIVNRYSEQARFWYSLNPMVGVIDGFRWCITGEPMYWPGLLLSIVITFFFCLIGIRYFRKTEKSFADNI
ncbi:ABC transporter permease [Paraflavitalea sp. CAU 1676]|uniref:ABC transporter permease n=1 Tax=Paraflavitalea sp. CAU 1676 TaxID=3032598 RepID=UPI0023D9CA71|nr:ABC transporter permease [Paraflavitalea sp. CAU 1676]MDF2187053.1 ABC transporter permease [Paraflavitalea sp. CAU 1676]